MSKQLQKQLEQIEYDTLNGDTALATITEISESRRSKIKVTVELPSGRRHSEKFKLPETNSDSYEFVRLLESMNYGLVTATEAEGSEIEVKFNDEGPNIVIPEKEETIVEQTRQLVNNIPSQYISALGLPLVILAWPIAGLSIYPKYHKQWWGRSTDATGWLTEYLLVGYSLSVFSWFIIAIFIYNLLL